MAGLLGMGTYLGAATEAGDVAYATAASAFWEAGGRHFDSAANYRGGRSERAIGRVLPGLPRSEVFVSTKAGYLPMGDGLVQESPREWFERTLARPGILAVDEVVDGCHALTPRYLRHQLGHSLEALGLTKVDVFHLHNPEQQRPSLGPEGFLDVMRRAFETCEALVAEGHADAYGCATWDGFRVPPEAENHLSLEALLRIAEAVGGRRHHHFRWIQLPLNLGMPEAWLRPTQVFQGVRMPVLQAAQAAGLQVQTSASILQGRLLKQLPGPLVALLGARTPAQAALQFTRSVPGVSVALCGMSRVDHVLENAEVIRWEAVEENVLRGLLGGSD